MEIQTGMRLFEAIIDANHRALAGDAKAGLRPTEYAESLPIVALTCIDPRLNRLFPQVVGVPEEMFIWLRNAGNIITSTQSSTMRSLALACAIKGGKEIAIIGHNDCQVCKATMMQLIEAFRIAGVGRNMLPENVTEFFGLFASEQQNVIKSVDFAKQSPLIGAKVPVHGLMVDIDTGRLEWVVNGYEAMQVAKAPTLQSTLHSINTGLDQLKGLQDFQIGEMKFPETKIGEAVTSATNWLSTEMQKLEAKLQGTEAQPEPEKEKPKRIPLPPPIRPKFKITKK